MSRLSSPAGLANEASTVAERIVRKTTTASVEFSFTPEEHAGRTFVLDAVVITDALTITLPKAIGGGDVYTVFNNAVQTQSIIVAALGADIMSGVAIGFSQTVAEAGDLFLTTATSDKITLNITTTGGLRGDYIQLTDYVPGTWLVRMHFSGSGTLATPFTET